MAYLLNMEKHMELLIVRKDVFRIKLGSDAPASVTPFVTNLEPNARAVRCKARHYSNDQSDFLKEFTDTLVKYGLIFENYNTEWTSPVQVVKKKKGFRILVDLRAVNAQCEATAWPMPFLESIVQYLSGSQCWFSLDAFKGFWTMPLNQNCLEIFSFITDRAVFTLTRSIQGGLNSATQFQARMAEIFTDLLYKSVIIWIDDVLGYGPTEQTWFSTLRRTLQFTDKFNLKLNIDKCQFF
jgi:hypothetical protein